MKKLLSAALILLTILQAFPQGGKVKVTGKVIDNLGKQPLEYATIAFVAPDQKVVAGGITDAAGTFTIDVPRGNYTINVEFISFKKQTFTRQINADTNLGTITLAEDAQEIQGVVVRAERTEVEIKLDKKVYNVGQDLIVKGGTVSDVLDNIPSVSVDAEGTVSLRGNENVRILIDGRPSNAINIQEALRLIPADAIDKVEVVTNPSARYDSEGGGGLLNIILKKGKNDGVNGTVIASTGYPEQYGISGNINYKTKDFNLFTTTGYNYRMNPGNSLTDTRYFNPDGTTRNFINERRDNDRLSRSFNTNFGMDWFLTEKATWTNQIRIRKTSSNNNEDVFFYNYDANKDFLFTNSRLSDVWGDDEEVEYSTNFVQKFDKDGDHTLTFNGRFSIETDDDFTEINNFDETTRNKQRQGANELQADYVLPLGKESRFEAGYRGTFNNTLTDFEVNLKDDSGMLLPDPRFTNTLEYKEKINALYTQYGTKFNKFSILLGLRWEDSKIDINQIVTSEFATQKYSNFFPSAFLTYEIEKDHNVSFSYSRRISRPRGRMINPFSNYSSNINIFRGNPTLRPAFSDAFDIGYLKRWNKLTLSTSMYLNVTNDSFQFVRQESGDFVTTQVGGVPVDVPIMLTSPVNLATQYRAGFEFTLNYSPYKWWRMNSNFNLFRNETQGDFTYTDFNGSRITQNFDNVAYSWFARLNSKITLPYKIDWQTNMTYNGPQTNAQGKSLGVFSANLGFSKDVLKDKGTIALNVQDLFNSRKRIYETFLPGVLESYSEMQWRERTITVSFTYRFNRQKNERDQNRMNQREEGMEEFGG
ncbi:MAG TPA: outer membrane beta-barrel family protein [Flavobacterium sp.]|nr:outer membrane beta-barrel family protein [Flavobacterium sp.]